MADMPSDAMAAEEAATQCTQPSFDPRRTGRNNSGLSADDVADVICILHPATPAAFRLVSDTALRAPQHILQNAHLRRADRSDAAVQLDQEDTFILVEAAGEQALDLALRFSTRTHQPDLGFVVGRNAAICDIVVRADSHRRVSNVHFAIFFNNTGVLMLRDMSTNGTMVDEVLLKGKTTHHPHSRMLSPGSVIQILSPSKDEVIKFIVRFPSRDGYYEEYDKMFQAYMTRCLAAQALWRRAEGIDAPGMAPSAPRPPTAIKAPVPHNQFGMHWNGGDVYNVVGHIGKGAFASVYQIATKLDGQLFAAKELEKRRFMKNGLLDRKLENEMRIMQSIDHPSIVAYHDYQDIQNHLYIIMEFVPCGDLQHFLAEHGPLPEPIAKQMASQVFDALDYLHKKNITHRDIKPENILLSTVDPNHFTIKLSDFGLSKAVSNNDTFLKTFCGTLLYCAPEVFPHYDTHPANKGTKRSRRPQGTKAFRSYSHAVDIWSFGAVLWYSLCHKPPFEGVADNTGRGMFDKIMMTPPDAADLAKQGVSEEAVALLVAMLNTDPLSRPSAEECLRLSWFSGVKRRAHRRPRRELGAILEEDQLDAVSGAEEPDITGLSLDERGVEELLGSYQSEVSLTSADMNFFDFSRRSKRVKTGDADGGPAEEEENYLHSSPELVGDIPIMHQEQPSNPAAARGQAPATRPRESDFAALGREGDGAAEDTTSSLASRSGAESDQSHGQDAQNSRARASGQSPSLQGAESMVREMDIDSSFSCTFSHAEGSEAALSQRSSVHSDAAKHSHEAQAGDEEETPRLRRGLQATTYTRRISIPLPPSFYWDPADPSTHTLEYASKKSGRDYSKGWDRPSTNANSLTTTAAQSKPSGGVDQSSINDSKTASHTRSEARPVTAPALSPSVPHAEVPGPRPRFGRLISTKGSAPDLILDLHHKTTSYGRSSRCSHTHPDRADVRVAKHCITIFFHAPELGKNPQLDGDLDSIKGLYCGVITLGRCGVSVNGVQLDKGEPGKQPYGKVHTGDIIEVWPGHDHQPPLRFYLEVYHGTTRAPRSKHAPPFQLLTENQPSRPRDHDRDKAAE